MAMTQTTKADRLWPVSGGAFTLLFVGLALFHHPRFPVFTPYAVVLPYWLPLCGFLPVFFLLYAKRVWLAVGWLVAVAPLLLLFNTNLLRPDVYFLWLCLLLSAHCTHREQLRFGLRMVLAGMYIWTGIHKINPDFMELTPPFLQKRLFGGHLPQGLVNVGVMAFPFVEVTLGILCLLPLAKPRAILGILLHAGILGMLLLGGWNTSMVPWNVFLLLCFVFLWNETGTYSAQNIRAAWIPALFSWLFPVLFFVGVWPLFASWTMYSARVESYYVDIPEDKALNPPPYIRNYVYSLDGTYYVGLTQWADSETGGAPCSEPWLKGMVFRQTREYIENAE